MHRNIKVSKSQSNYLLIAAILCSCDRSHTSDAELIAAALDEAFSTKFASTLPDPVTEKAVGVAYLQQLTAVDVADCPEDFQLKFEQWVEMTLIYVSSVGTEMSLRRSSELPTLRSLNSKRSVQSTDWS